MNGPVFEVESFGHDERSTQFTQNGCCDSLVASDYKQPIIVAYIMDAMSSNSMKSNNPHSGFHSSETAKCLDTKCLDPSCNQGGMMVCQSIECFTKQFVNNSDISPTLEATDYKESPLICYEGQNCCTDSETSFTLQAGRPDDHHIPGICYAVENHPNDSRVTLSDDGIVQSLTSRMGTGGGNVPLTLICKCFQNTGQGWWNEGEIAETLRTPCGGDSTKANLVVMADREKRC